MAGKAGEDQPTMKILVLTTLHAPNDDRIYYKEMLSLCRKFSDVTLVAPDDGNQWADAGHRVRFRPIRQRAGPLGRVLKLLAAMRAVWRMGPDVVHFHDYDVLLVAPIMRYLLRCRLVYDAHEDFPAAALMSERLPRALRPAVARLVRLFELTIARCCSLIITADNPTAEYLGTTGVRVCVLFNYPRLELFSNAGPAEGDRLGVFADHDVIVYQGSMGENRGLFHMVRAMPGILDQRPDCRLLLIGLRHEGLCRRTLALADELGVQGAVCIVPWVPHLELYSYLGRAKLGLVPLQPVEKYKRNIPIKLFEYMACGLPVLAADLPSIRPYMEQSMAGLLYDSTSPDALAAGALRMLSDQDGLRRMGENGRRAVREKWNWDKMEERLFEAYDELNVQIGQCRTPSGRGQTGRVSARLP